MSTKLIFILLLLTLNPKGVIYNMKKRVVFIIGASSGIGLATAKKLCDEGNIVYCGSRTPCPDERVTSLCVNVTDEKTVFDAVTRITEETGRIEQLIYSAGCSMAAPVEFAEEKDYRYLFDVNYFGALAAIRAVLPHMRKQAYGRIALVSSMGGVLPIAYDAFYSSSKAALIMLAKELNMEVAPFGINASAVLPGGTATRFTFKRKVYPEEKAGVYAADMDKSVGSLAGMEQGGMDADEVADTIIKTLLSDNPPAVIASGLANKAYYITQKILPEKLTRHFVNDKYNLS